MIVFIHESEEWGYVGKALARYFEHCHGKKKAEFKVRKKDSSDWQNCNDIDILLVPLFEGDEPEGLKTVKALREKKCYNFYTVFLVASPKDIPQYFNQHLPMNPYAQEIIQNPEFGDTRKAVFLAEVRYKNDNNGKEFINIINLSGKNEIDRLSELVNSDPEVSENKILEDYYSTFVKYYSHFNNNDLTLKDNEFSINISDITEKIYKKEYSKQIKNLLKNHYSTFVEYYPTEFLKLANRVYNCLNGIEEKTGGHTVPLELFRAPVPFPLQELVDAKKEIEKALEWEKGKEGKTIKLFLIDNKVDKFKSKGKETIYDVLKIFGIEKLFSIEMISTKKGTEINDNDEKFEQFDFVKFKNRDELNESEKKYYKQFFKHRNFQNIKTYTDLIYHKLKSSHFILLDFFLNEENTCLAFDFIKDICKIKKQEGDYSTTWYFIASAVYDSVVKYSQSGLLAEYYESAVVNAGDDPTNKRRQIIYVYKLITFIQSRLRSFVSYKTAIYNHLLSDEKGHDNGVCCVTATNKSIQIERCLQNCEKDDCLEKMQTHIKRYLTEYDNIWSLFYDEKHKRDYKDIAVLLDDTIRKFLWLPDADWQRIQHQIDFINAKLKTLGENRMFSCKYINGELEKRSEIY